MKPPSSAYSVGVFTHVGHYREHNEDLYALFSCPLGEVFLVCDGMGGHGAGDVAAHLAVERIKEVLSGASAAFSPAYWFRRAFYEAHHAILEASQQGYGALHMGTTAVALLLTPGGEAWWAHTGDSRLYLWRRGKLTVLTHDHSYVSYLVDSGQITPEAAFNHPHSNQLLFSLGGAQGFTLVETSPYPLRVEKGDRFLLCSDGVSGLLPEKQMENLLSAPKPPAELAQDLVNQALDAGGHDNATVIVVEIKEAPKEASVQGSFWKVGLGALAGFLIGVGGALWAFQGGAIPKSWTQQGPPDSSQTSTAGATNPKGASPIQAGPDTASGKGKAAPPTSSLSYPSDSSSHATPTSRAPRTDNPPHPGR
ncbi:MAG: hypothetical protein KatS3mg026_0806 [Bacteroidia bacterium]|nr:MAG: hypothetical protein KatS3mg026_0806 [Bacteroidia bacterium]